MKRKKKSGKLLTNDYETARKSLIARMESEDEERTNIKIKIATFVIYQLSHSTPSWFKSYFLSNISQDADKTNLYKNQKIVKVENEFFNNIGDYLINLESEVDYVKKILAPLTEEWNKKDFWKPLVADAFLLAEIYFASPLESGKNDSEKIGREQSETNTNTQRRLPMSGQGSVAL
ncbi:MAG: hypothetical protein ABFD75_01940 [Smithella sp.]